MGVIKKHYENVRLSDEQKAEIKYALKDRFPQYARTGSKREVINMENERITDTGARVKTHSKLKAGIAATAAAALLFTAGVAAIHRTETGISPGSANTGYDGRQTGYIDDSSSEYFADAKTIYNHLVETTVGFEVQGIRYVEDCAVINRDTLLAAREQNMICDPQEGSLVNAFELVAMLDENLKEEEDIDLGELDFEIWIDTNLMSPQYVFIYPDESRSSWYSYPRYEEKQSGYIEDEESEYYMLARTYNNCIAKIVANSEINGISFDEDCFVISRETVLEARIKGIVPTEDDYELNALELAAMLDNDLAARGMDPGEVDFEILIDLSDDEPIYVLVYPDDTHESWYSCPAYETESDGKVECTTVIDDNDEPQEIEIPEGYLDDIESVHFAQATEIHDTFFKVLAEAELEGQEFYDMFAKIFEQKLTDTYGDELANMDFEIAYGELDEVLVDHSDGRFDLYDLQRADLIPKNVQVYVYPDDSHKTYYRCPSYNYLTVPDVTGMSRVQAESILRMAGFNVVLQSGYDGVFPEDTITAIEPPVGHRVAEGSDVTLHISMGPLDTAREKSAEDDLDAMEQMQKAQEAEKTKEEVRKQEEYAQQMEKEADVTTITVEIP